MEANISEKRTVSIFRAEDPDSMLLQKLVSTNQSTQQRNSQDHHQNCYHCENLKSHKRIVQIHRQASRKKQEFIIWYDKKALCS
jgi:hypothetical protein